MNLCVVMRQNNVENHKKCVYTPVFNVKFVSHNIHIEVPIVMSIYNNFYEFLSIYVAKNHKKFKQLISTMDFNTSELSIVQY
jgi:hypothetical protein